MNRVLVLLAMLVFSAQGDARSAAARGAFVKAHPCPATGKAGKCPGYVVDHIVPLCAGGGDASSNMQWQTVAEAKVKDRLERRQCGRKTR